MKLCALVVAALVGVGCKPVVPPAPVPALPGPPAPVWHLRSGLEAGGQKQVVAFGVPGDSQYMFCDLLGTGDVPVTYADGLFRHRDQVTSGKAAGQVAFGVPGSQGLCGDWLGDGVDRVATWRAGSWNVNFGDHEVGFQFGAVGDVPVAGDWNGDGVDGIGVYRNGRFLLREVAGPGAAQRSFVFGSAVGRPVVGDWDGDGVDGVGVFASSTWSLRETATAGSAQRTVSFGKDARYKPVVGNWGGRGDRIGVVSNWAGNGGGNMLAAAEAVRVANDPVGKIDWVRADTGSLVVAGHATDPNFRGPIGVVVSVDGVDVAALETDELRGAADRSGFTAVLAPTTGAQVCLRALNVGAGSAPVVDLGCVPVDARAGLGSHAFITETPSGPGRWDPCRAVPYVINPVGMPAGGERDIHAAFAKVAELTGATVRFDGYTDETDVDNRWVQPARYPGRYAPVLVTYAHLVDYPLLGRWAAFGGPQGVQTPDGFQFVSGHVIVNRTLMEDMGWQAGLGAGTSHARVMLHEVGHVFGLHHSSDPWDTMAASLPSRAGGFSIGDVAGLRVLGSNRTCLPVQTPPGPHSRTGSPVVDLGVVESVEI